MKFRMHRGTLKDSISTTVDVQNRSELLAHIRQEFSGIGPSFEDHQLQARPYGGDDDRIGWKDVHIVTIDGYGPVGFCEGQPQ